MRRASPGPLGAVRDAREDCRSGARRRSAPIVFPKVVTMKEKLSALIDGELQSDSLHAHLGRLRADPDLRGAWDTYHLIGDALRGQISPGIADRVVARLREEPTVLAPRAEETPPGASAGT